MADITGMAGGKPQGVAFLVGSMAVSGTIAAACSSPQTAEINADKRAATLMKWVHIGVVQAILLIGLAAIIDPAHRKGILAGGGMTLAIMYSCYVHAKSSGTKSNLRGTES